MKKAVPEVAWGLLVFWFLAGCDRPPGGAELPSQNEEEPAVSPPPTAPTYAREMEELVSRPEVQQALDWVEALEGPSVGDLVRLTETPAPPFQEEARARLFADMLRSAGADSVWLDEVGNVLALRKGTVGDRTVVVDGHLDTVFPPGTDVTVRFRGDTLFAPGVGDDSRGLVVVRNVLAAMVQAGLRTRADVLFVGTVGEEGLGDLRGVKHLFREGGRPIHAFIGVDGGGHEEVVNRAVGSLRFRVTYRGPGGHSWGAFGLANPHNALGAAIQAFVSAAESRIRQGPRTSYNIGRVGGGTSVNSIPFESWMEVDIRSLDPLRLEMLETELRVAVREGLLWANGLRRLGDSLTVSLEKVGDRPAGGLDPEATPLVQRALAAIRRQGGEPKLRSGSTNANIPIALGIPAVTLGRGGVGGGAHSLEEWWLPKDGHLASQNLLLVLLAEGGLGGEG